MKTDRSFELSVACAAAFGFVFAVSEVSGLAIRVVEPRFSPLVAGVVLSFVVVGIAARKGRLLVASIAALALVPVVAVAASFFLDMPLLDMPARAELEPRLFGRLGPVDLRLIVILGVGAIVAGLVALVVSRVCTYPLVRIVFRFLALVALTASIAAVVLALRKSRTSIDPDELRSRIEPIPGRLPDLSSEFRETYDPFPPPPENKSATIQDDDARLTYNADLKRGTCEIRVEPSSAHGPHGLISLPSARLTSSDLEGPEATTCEGVTVARIPEMHLWILSKEAWPSNHDMALIGPPFRKHGVMLESFAQDLAPPRAWIALAITGILAAIVIALTAFRDRALEAALLWSEVEVDGKTILRDPKARDGLYRGSLDPSFHTHMILGSREELFGRIGRKKAARWALVLAVVMVTVTPLAVAASYGLLSI